MATQVVTCPKCGDDSWNDDAERARGVHDGCSPELVDRRRIALPDVIGEELTWQYRDGTVSRWSFTPLGDRMMFSVKHGDAQRWSPMSSVTNPERFGPVPTTTDRKGSRELAAWVDAWLVAAS